LFQFDVDLPGDILRSIPRDDMLDQASKRLEDGYHLLMVELGIDITIKKALQLNKNDKKRTLDMLIKQWKKAEGSTVQVFLNTLEFVGINTTALQMMLNNKLC